jgi:CheY-like chemotaxis protein
VGQLAGGVAHDFNNLLTAVLGYSQMLLARHGNDPELRHPIEQIEQAGQRAATLTRRLLAFSRKQILQPETVDLNQVASGLAGMLRRLIGEDIELVTILAPALDPVRVDPGQVEQVIMNLVVNARDAMPDGGRLTIATANTVIEGGPDDRADQPGPGCYVEISVADTGCGMDEVTRARVFEPFFTTKESGKGTGLGLATVYGIVRQSGGHVLVTTAPGAGSTFRVLLPRLKQTAAPAPHAAAELRAGSEAMVGGSEAILLVEDEEMVRTLTRRVLEDLGYRVHEATNGVDALSFAEQHADRIDLLLSDVVMPRMSGCELAATITPQRPEMKLLYMSGYAERNLESDGGLRPSGPVLHKPFSPAALARKVREVLEAA